MLCPDNTLFQTVSMLTIWAPLSIPLFRSRVAHITLERPQSETSFLPSLKLYSETVSNVVEQATAVEIYRNVELI